MAPDFLWSFPAMSSKHWIKHAQSRWLRFDKTNVSHVFDDDYVKREKWRWWSLQMCLTYLSRYIWESFLSSFFRKFESDIQHNHLQNHRFFTNQTFTLSSSRIVLTAIITITRVLSKSSLASDFTHLMKHHGTTTLPGTMPKLSERLKSAWAVISGQQLCRDDLELQNECLSIAMMMSLMAQSKEELERRRQMEQAADTEKSSGPGI